MIRKQYLAPMLIVIVLATVAWASQGDSKIGQVESSDGLTIAYETQGKGEAALVFVHGWCCDRTYWKHQLPILSKKYKVVTVDLGGHGDSGLGRRDWTMQAFAADVKAVVEKLDLDRVILVGHSMGGTVIVETARQMPDRVIGLIGADTFTNVEAYFAPEQIQAFLKTFRRDFKDATGNYLKNFMFSDQTDTMLIKVIVDDMSSAPPEVALSAMEHYMKYSMVGALQDMRLPIRSINSNQFPLNYSGGKRHAKEFEVEFMDGVGHFVMLEDPREFNKRLEDAVQKLLSSKKQEQK